MIPLHSQNPSNQTAIKWVNLLNNATTAHAGLLFDKFPAQWEWKNKRMTLADNAKKDFYNSIVQKYERLRNTNLFTANLNTALTRQGKLIDSLQGDCLTVNTDWRFVSGLGAAHPYETGFVWHRTLGVPYLPGSSVKGLMRAWATHWGGLEDDKEISRLFGPDDKAEQADTGSLIIFDALPLNPPKLELDILNPHYSEYYQNPSTPPADYLSPVPVFFLTVAPRQSFEFFIAHRPCRQTNDQQKQQNLHSGIDLLKQALTELGAGGKTAVGYGLFKSEPDCDKQWGAKFRDAQRTKTERLASLTPIKIQVEQLIKDNKIQESQIDTFLLKQLLSGLWSGEEATEVAQIIKQLMIKNEKWIPGFTGTNAERLKNKQRSLEVCKYLPNEKI